MTCPNRLSRFAWPAADRPLAVGLVFASLAIVTIDGAAQAQGPSELKWWSRQFNSDERAVDHSTVQATAVSSPAIAVSAESDHTNLRWWEANSAVEDLNWWSANSAAREQGWRHEERSQTAVIAVQDEFAPPPAAQRSPAPAVPRQPLPDEGRTRGAEGVEFDPFGVIPPLKPLSDISASLASVPADEQSLEGGEPPFNGTAEEYFAQKGSVFLATRVWQNRTPEAAAYQFYSRPLWYEDANLERCGYTTGCLQPVVSGTYFLANTALLPYRFAAEPQCSVVPQKGFCAPGCRYSHRDNYLPRWSPAGAISQAAAVTGLVFLIP